MPVSIDNAILNAEQLGLNNVGQVLEHVATMKRVAVGITIDGQPPELSDQTELRAIECDGHLIQIESADPREMALDALSAMEEALGQADAAREKVSDLLGQNQTQAAMSQLGACLGTWQQAQQCVADSAQLVGIDLEEIKVEGEELSAIVSRFGQQLKEIRRALQDQDYVALGDVLRYELGETGRQWRGAVMTLSTAVAMAG